MDVYNEIYVVVDIAYAPWCVSAGTKRRPISGRGADLTGVCLPATHLIRKADGMAGSLHLPGCYQTR